MFWHSFKYKIRTTLGDKGLIFWILIFPIVLGTLFKISFGNYMENEEVFDTIETAYVSGEEKEVIFEEVLDALNGDEGILKVHTLNMEEAEKKLLDGEVKGIIINDKDGVSLMVSEEGIYQTILKSIIEQYEQKKSTIENILVNSPEKLEDVIKIMTESGQYIRQEALTEGSMDSMMSYFYALISMTCLYGSLLGADCAKQLKANISPVAARKTLGSINKRISILSEMLACVTVQSAIMLIAIVYLKYILGVNIGDKVGLIFLTAVVGGIIGIAQGMLIASVGNKISSETKSSIVLVLSLAESFLSGLMIGNMKDIVEKHAPFINRINPAALISDALYSLEVYDDYSRYSQNLITMLIMAAVFVAISYVVMRRERYASI